MSDFYKYKAMMESFVTGDMARESLELAENEYLMLSEEEKEEWNNKKEIKKHGRCVECANFNACNEDGDQEPSKLKIKGCFAE